MEKDSKHAGSVEVEGHFFPLVTETLGVWTPSNLLLLRTFAGRTTLRNGLSPSIVARNLVQQLSVKLWSYNAKMILQHFRRLSTSPAAGGIGVVVDISQDPVVAGAHPARSGCSDPPVRA